MRLRDIVNPDGLRGVQFYRGHKLHRTSACVSGRLRGVQFYRGHKQVVTDLYINYGLRGVQFYRGHKLNYILAGKAYRLREVQFYRGHINESVSVVIYFTSSGWCLFATIPLFKSISA